MAEVTVDHVVLTSVFNKECDEKEHDEQLEVASHLIENFSKTKVICWNKTVMAEIPLQKRCRAFGIEPACRGKTLWRLLGVKDAPLSRKASAAPLVAPG